MVLGKNIRNSHCVSEGFKGFWSFTLILILSTCLPSVFTIAAFTKTAECSARKWLGHTKLHSSDQGKKALPQGGPVALAAAKRRPSGRSRAADWALSRTQCEISLECPVRTRDNFERRHQGDTEGPIWPGRERSQGESGHGARYEDTHKHTDNNLHTGFDNG